MTSVPDNLLVLVANASHFPTQKTNCRNSAAPHGLAPVGNSDAMPKTSIGTVRVARHRRECTDTRFARDAITASAREESGNGDRGARDVVSNTSIESHQSTSSS